MTIEATYIDEGRGVIIRASNSVTGKEIIAINEKLLIQHGMVMQQYHIIDKSWCTEYDVSAADIEAISKLDKKMAEINSELIIAVIESKTLRFSLTEVWQVYVESFINHTKSFNNQVEAIAWVNNLLLMQNKQSLTSQLERIGDSIAFFDL